MAAKQIYSNDDERFWARVIPIPEAGCWLFDGSVVGDGYASIQVGLVRDCSLRTVRAHRWAYERFCGPIPPGMVVCHACDVPCCVNPRHLFVGTQQVNISDKTRKNRQAKGSRNGASKLNDSLVGVIKQRLSNYKVGMYTAIGAEFGVDRSIVKRIHCGKAWRHVR